MIARARPPQDGERVVGLPDAERAGTRTRPVTAQLEEDHLVAAPAQPAREVQDLVAVGVIAMAEEQAGARRGCGEEPDLE